MEINLIQWSEALEPSATCPYNHVQGKSPFGDLLITWKGWKERPEYELEQAPWSVVEGGGLIEYSLKDIKQATEQVFWEKLKECLPISTPYSEAKRPDCSQISNKGTVIINLNATVTCTLTKDGWGTFYDHYRERGLDPEPYAEMIGRRPSGGQVEMQLWELMFIFGKQMYMGNNRQIFVDNELKVGDCIKRDLRPASGDPATVANTGNAMSISAIQLVNGLQMLSRHQSHNPCEIGSPEYDLWGAGFILGLYRQPINQDESSLAEMEGYEYAIALPSPVA